MNLSSLLFLAVVTTVVCQTDAQGSDEGAILLPQSNHNGWVNPEDLVPMPQCIAQQDESQWLNAMTACTQKRCTSHFIFCTHYQWLVELSCLNTHISPELVRKYLPYCSRSVLAKAQLYQWVRRTTGRTWLAEVGDANGLENPSTDSLTRGFADISVTTKAPICLTEARSVPSAEQFQHVMGSCSFEAVTRRTGQADRPWEYNPNENSIIALSVETVGYDLTGRTIRDGEFFDKECFCGTFAMDQTKEPCPVPVVPRIDQTSERLWLIATCGATYLPQRWTQTLKIIGDRYITLPEWRWPTCVIGMPEKITSLVDECKTEACQLDSMGYCRPTAAISKTCFCSHINYGSCKGLCHSFEARKEYVEWLHDLCGSLEDWHGLPANWHDLTAPTAHEMIPWSWNLEPTERHTPNNGFIKSLILITVSSLVAFLNRDRKPSRFARTLLWSPQHWASRGIFLACLQLCANVINANLVQATTGYENIPVNQLILLWLTIPRLGWLNSLPSVLKLHDESKSLRATSSLLSETLLQLCSVYYMAMTVYYGLQHKFFSLDTLAGAERAFSVRLMYHGSLLWVIVAAASTVQLAVLLICQMIELPEKKRCESATRLAPHADLLPKMATMSGEKYVPTMYGTASIPLVDQNYESDTQVLHKLFMTTAIMSIPILWITQWLFWWGFLGVARDEYVLDLSRITRRRAANQTKFPSPEAYGAYHHLGDYFVRRHNFVDVCYAQFTKMTRQAQLKTEWWPVADMAVCKAMVDEKVKINKKEGNETPAVHVVTRWEPLGQIPFRNKFGSMLIRIITSKPLEMLRHCRGCCLWKRGSRYT